MNMVETNPQAILDAASNAIVSGDLTPEAAAAGIESIFDAAALHNNTMEGGFNRVGLDNQETYNARLSVPPGFFARVKKSAKVSALLHPLTIGLAPNKVKDFLFGDETEVRATANELVDLMDGAKVSQHLVRLSLTVKRDTDKLNK